MIRRTVWLALLLVCSCSHVEQDVQEVRQSLLFLHRSQQEMLLQVKRLRSEHDELTRLVGCPNSDMRDFMRACVSTGNFVCSAQDVDKVIRAMTASEHVMAYVATAPDSDMALERVGELKELLRKHTRLSTTRLLVVSAPRGATSADTVQAEQAAMRLRNQVLKDLYPTVHPTEPALPTLPPLQLACNQRDEILRRYRQTMPTRVKSTMGEPTEKDKRIMIWFFLVDC